MLFEGWPHKLLPFSLEEDETKKKKNHIGKQKKPEKLLEKQKIKKTLEKLKKALENPKTKKKPDFMERGGSRQAVPVFPACCTVPPFGLPDSQGPFFSKQGVSPKASFPCKTILYHFQGNLDKGMPHCSQGMQWSLKVQLLLKEYLFKIMLDFLQGILFLFK